MSQIERVLESVEQRVDRAPEELFALVYDELRKLAADRLRRESPGQTWQATALVHEVYLRLVAPYRDQHWDGRGHFFAAAAEAMRRIQIERARAKKRQKRGGEFQRVEQELAEQPDSLPPEDLLALDEALEQLAATDPEKARLVMLRYFAGLSVEEASDVLGLSRSTGQRYWRYARAWLYRRLNPAD